MSFAYGVLSNNDYSDQDIIELAKNYLPDSISLSDDMLLKLIETYKGEYFPENNLSTSNTFDTTNESSLVKGEFKSESSNDFEKVQKNENIIGAEKIKLDYFERTNSRDFDLKTIRWLRSNLNVIKEKDANVLSINFTSINPELSKLIANAISEEYLDYQRISKESEGLYWNEYYQENMEE